MINLQSLAFNLGRFAMLTALVLVGLFCLALILFEVFLLLGAGLGGGSFYLMLNDPPEFLKEIIG